MKHINSKFFFDNLFTIILLISGTAVFPLFFYIPTAAFSTVQILFSLSSISSLSLAFLLLNYRKFNNKAGNRTSLPVIAFLFLLIPTFHFFIYQTYTFREWSFSILWISLPFFAYLFAKTLERIFPVYLYILWIFDLLLSFLQKGQIVGLAGNRNWHASFLIILTILGWYYSSHIYKKCSKTYTKIFVIVIASILSLYSFYVIYSCHSRGAWLSLLSALIIFLILRLYNGYLNHYVKCAVIIFSVIMIFSSSAIIIYQYNSYFKDTVSRQLTTSDILHNTNLQINRIDSSLFNDVRGPLWLGCIKLIKENPLLGVGTARFESVFAYYRPISYFTKPLSAVRSNHPHNTILYIAACYGIIGLCLWLILWLYPVFYCFRIYSKLSIYKKVILFAYTCLFIHGMLDLILFEWPTLFVAGLFIGVLWTEIWKPEKGQKQQNNRTTSKAINFSAKLTAFILIIMTARVVYNDYISSYYFRFGKIAQFQNKYYNALYFYNKGLTFAKDPKFIYLAATVSVLNLDNPKLALKFLSYYDKISTFDYAHKNSFIALALVKLNKPEAALPYLIKAVINYPLVTGNWYRLAFIQKQLGMTEASKVSYNNMLKTISFKELPKNALVLLLKNPEYDFHPQKIPEDEINKLKDIHPKTGSIH